jgi:predicted acylesterase/phospholipase RssA/CRP-like cAMP-binding protein
MNHLSHFELFKGLSGAELKNVGEHLRLRTLRQGEYLCHKGEQGECLWLIEKGLLEVRLPDSGTAISLLRRHDLVGEASLLTAAPRSADVVAVLPSRVLELDQPTFAVLTAQHPLILQNVIAMLLKRQVHQNERLAHSARRAELVTLVVGAPSMVNLASVVAAAERILDGKIYLFDLTGRIDASACVSTPGKISVWLESLDEILNRHRSVINVVEPETKGLQEILLHSDRVVLLMDAPEAERFGRNPVTHLVNRELILMKGADAPGDGALRQVRPAWNKDGIDPRWLARHLTRTKLGLALGAGGAKGFAHVAAIRTLREAGYTFDYVSGASIGSIVGAGVAMRLNDDELAHIVGHLLSYEVCGPFFRLNKEFSLEEGLQVFFDALGEFAGCRRIEDLPTPYALMTADLNSRGPFLFREGSLSEALCAALSIPGLAPPFAHQDRRLVDGVTISPVPTHSVRDLGADIVVAVNLMSRDDLTAWPVDDKGHAPEIKPSSPIDPVVETVIMLQTDTSIRHAAEADVIITPRFGPCSWRDIHYAALIEQAGRRAAEESLPLLRSLSQPA